MEATKPSLFLYRVASITAFSSFIQNYLSCVIAGALIFIVREYQLDSLQEGHATSILSLGALMSPCFIGFFADRFGRKLSLALPGVVFLICGLSFFWLDSFNQFLLVRFGMGLAVGVTSVIVPLYLAEISPNRSRGFFVSFYQLSLTLGTLAAYGINYLYSTEGNWRAMFSVTTVPIVLLLLGLLAIPESPRWLMKIRRTGQAQQIAAKLRIEALPDVGVEKKLPFSHIWAQYRFRVFLGMILCVVQQLSGIAVITFYTPKILKCAGLLDDQLAIAATLWMGVFGFLSTIVMLYFVDRVGRRKLLFMSLSGVLSALLILSLSSFFEVAWLGKAAVGAIFLFISSYSFGLGPITWIIVSELYPISIRAKLIGFFNFLGSVATYSVVFLFPLCHDSLGAGWTFFFYAAVCGIAFLFFLKYLPETKGTVLS